MRQGDDLERANIAFGHMTEQELDQPHGMSGRTRRQVWQGYKDDHAKVKEAAAWVEELVQVCRFALIQLDDKPKAHNIENARKLLRSVV